MLGALVGDAAKFGEGSSGEVGKVGVLVGLVEFVEQVELRREVTVQSVWRTEPELSDTLLLSRRISHSFIQFGMRER